MSVTPSQQPSKVPGKTFSQLEVAFKNLTFGGKVEGKKIMGFGDTKPAYDVLMNATANDVFDITVVKNGQYANWTNAVKSTGGQVQPANRSAGGLSTSTGSVSPKSTYETPEERAKKQIYIVRQSSISSAIDLLSVGSKAAPKVDEVLEVAKQFEAYVFGANESKSLDTFADLEDKTQFDDVPL